MHIPDGYLGPSTYGSLWAVMLGVWSYASRKVQREIRASQAPHLAMASAFSFVVMIIAVPLPGGTTAHVTGAALVAILLGPWAAVIAVSVALMIQSLVFGDGGITALAANCFNIAFASSLAGYGTYRSIVGIARRFGEKGATSPEESGLPGRALQMAATAIASYTGINIAALLTAVELGLQPLIHGSGPAAGGYFPYGPEVTLPAVVLPHLVLVGALEALVAAAVIGFMRKGRMSVKYGGTTAFIIAAHMIVQASGAYAHDFLIEQRGQELLPGVEVIGFDHAKRGATDRDGIIKVPLTEGLNLVTVEYKEKIKDDPDADALSLTATLTFEVKQ